VFYDDVRYELDTLQVTFHDELMTYSEWIEVFIKWFYKSITEARAEKVRTKTFSKKHWSMLLNFA